MVQAADETMGMERVVQVQVRVRVQVEWRSVRKAK